jgi:hypothetical protein
MLSGVVTKSSTRMIWLTMRNRIVIWKGSLDGVWVKRAGRRGSYVEYDGVITGMRLYFKRQL